MSGSTREWVNFFLKAGIPSDEAASYAIIFSRNRIQKNMLIDLNKEYLKDMGITLLGDVIAILKHAKMVHENNSRAWVMSETVEETNKIEDKKPVKSVTAGGSDTVKRLLDHYTRKYQEAEQSLTLVPKELKEEPVQRNEKVITSGKIRLKEPSTTQKLEVPLQKKWRVLPEHEGGYKIIMPKKLSTVAQTSNYEKKVTVFARLGDSAVSSTTSETTASGNKVSTSIFSRLGNVSTTSLDVSSSAVPKTGLPYAGVLKSPMPTKSCPVSASMRADVMGSQGKDISGSKVASQKDFLRSRDLKMLKITTEFLDDDYVEEPVESSARKQSDIIHKTAEKRRMGESDMKMYEEESPLTRPPKRVRFGGTSLHQFTEDSFQSTKESFFTGQTISAKQQYFPTTKTNKSSNIFKKEFGGVKSRIGIVKPSPGKPISKMASDRIDADFNKSSVKNRITSTTKPKSSVLDRLG